MPDMKIERNLVYPKPSTGKYNLNAASLLNGNSGERASSIIARQGRQPTGAERAFGSRSSVPFSVMPQRLRTAFGVPSKVSPAEHEADSQQNSQFPDAVFTFSAASKPEIREKVVFSTNQTRESVEKRRTLIPSRQISADTNIETKEKPMKTNLAIRKLHLGNVKNIGGFAHSTSYGGSFANSGENYLTARNLRTFNSANNVAPVRSIPHYNTGLNASPAPRAKGPTQRAQHNEISRPNYYNNSAYQPLGFTNTASIAPSNALSHNIRTQLPQQPSKPSQITVINQQNQLRSENARQQLVLAQQQAEHERQQQLVRQSQYAQQQQVQQQLQQAQQQRKANLDGLLQCCLEQAPGCRHLCTPDVKKEEVQKGTH